jgi:hypothetical protein
LEKSPSSDSWEKGITLEEIFCRVDSATNGALDSEIPLCLAEIYLREVGMVGKCVIGSNALSSLVELSWIWSGE